MICCTQVFWVHYQNRTLPNYFNYLFICSLTNIPVFCSLQWKEYSQLFILTIITANDICEKQYKNNLHNNCWSRKLRCSTSENIFLKYFFPIPSTLNTYKLQTYTQYSQLPPPYSLWHRRSDLTMLPFIFGSRVSTSCRRLSSRSQSRGYVVCLLLLLEYIRVTLMCE